MKIIANCGDIPDEKESQCTLNGELGIKKKNRFIYFSIHFARHLLLPKFIYHFDIAMLITAKSWKREKK
jgi:hypothetical protein